MENSYLVITLLIALDVFLWIAGIVLSVSSTNRFRLLSSAYLVLCLILIAFFGWQNAAMIAFAGLWVAAIVGGVGPGMQRPGQAA
jgi:hypothetical protein